MITKNGILVVEFANQLRKQGMSVDEAIFESSLIRLRPVLMTTISTLLGAVPLVMSSGAGAESRYSMAIVVLGGITLSSLVTLYLVPALYRLIENKWQSYYFIGNTFKPSCLEKYSDKSSISWSDNPTAKPPMIAFFLDPDLYAFKVLIR